MAPDRKRSADKIDGIVAAGSTTTGLSNMEVDQSQTGVTTIAGLHLVGIPDFPSQVMADDNLIYQVMPCLHYYRNAGGVSILGV